MKECNRCHRLLLLDQFHTRKRAPDKLQHYCKDCAKGIRHDHYARNKERVTEVSRRWRHAHPELTREYSRKYYWSHAEQRRKRSSGWRKENPLKAFALKQLRHEREGKRLRPSQLLAIWAAQDGICVYCEQYVELVDGHFDHRIPLARGGSNTPENVVWSCASCNLRKHVSLDHPASRCN